ncbi:MAG: alanine/ornithine racemase family PLP-dependent enzyme [Candidatus Muiribacteriota bacterium]
MNPKLLINLDKIKHNALQIQKLCKNIKIFGVTKVTCADIRVAEALLNSGLYGLGDSRIENIETLRNNFPDTPLLLLRLPMLSEIKKVVSLCDYVLISEKNTILEIEKEARKQNKKINLILMVDLGDLREGIWPDEMDEFVNLSDKLGFAGINGIGVNLACYGGVIPDKKKMLDLLNLKNKFEQKTNRCFDIISGGNSSSLPLVLNGELPSKINMLRIGEAIMLGRNVINRQPWPETYQDTFLLQAEIIELKDKPSLPIGNIGQDAFGNNPVFEDKGVHKRAILACGRQDINPDGLIPAGNYEVLGASSDHLIVDVENIKHKVKVGDSLKFMLSYGALLAAATSRYVKKTYID